MSIQVVEKQAKSIAGEQKKSDPAIQQVLWFPDDNEVRLVGVTPEVPESDDGVIHPFYFRPAPEDDLPVQSGIALILPDEVGKLRLPRTWGEWPAARILE